MTAYCHKACPCRSPRTDALSDTDVAVLADIVAVFQTANEEALLAVLNTVSGRVPPKRLAHLLSFPIQVSLLPQSRFSHSGVTLLYWSVMVREADVVQWLVDHGVCLHAGKTLKMACLWVPTNPRRQPTFSLPWKTPCFGLLVGRSCSKSKRCLHVLLHAGAFPSFWGGDSRDGSAQAKQLEKQWHAWHGRRTKVMWLRVITQHS
jgi:hypothetical protein